MRTPGELGPNGFESEQGVIEKELRGFNIESIPENIETVKELVKTANIPDGFEKIKASLNDPERLKIAMEESGIISITHSEGKTVWDHTRCCLAELQKLELDPETANDLRLILLYHDLGKTEVGRRPWNRGKTEERIKKGVLQLAMMGHDEARTDDICRSLQANGMADERLERAMIVIKNHMRVDLLIMRPMNIVPIIDSFGHDDARRRKTLDILALTIKVDGLGTSYTKLTDGELTTTHGVNKEHFDPETVWQRYEEGKVLLEKFKEEKAQRMQRNEREQSIFGTSLFEYLEQRGYKSGPDMGRVMKLVSAFLDEHIKEEPAAIRKMIDEKDF